MSASAPPQPASPKPIRKVSPDERLAKDLAETIGSNLNPCRKQVAALRRHGLEHEAIAAAILEHGSPGLPPWDFAKLVLGKNGPVTDTRSTFDRTLDSWTPPPKRETTR